MVILRYQSSHGFRTGQNRGLSKINPAKRNLREEVLNNTFHVISKDNWNQTLRKSKAFLESWARSKIRTVYPGSYNDEITKTNRSWDKGEELSLSEIVALKLYTDFDKLQFELKKCFRWETIVDIWAKDQRRVKHKDEADRQSRKNTHEDEFEEDEDNDEWDTKDEFEGDKHKDEGDDEKSHEALYLKDSKDQKDLLEARLSQFYYWRIELMVILNKFGLKMSNNHTKSSDNNLILYHGVNAKMILNPTETMAFFGPLSATSSYHVAKTFATDKGMILKITTQYPRLGTCKAFNASLISDYPEEQESVIGFI